MSSALAWQTISVALFDERWDGQSNRSLMAICLPLTECLALFSLTHSEDKTLKVFRLPTLSAISVASIRATRHNVSDLLVVKPNKQLVVLTHGLRELPLEFLEETSNLVPDDDSIMDVDAEANERLHNPLIGHGGVVSVQDEVLSSITLRCKDGWTARTNINLMPQDILTCQALHILAQFLPADSHYSLHRSFLGLWLSRGLQSEFDCFTEALYKTFDLEYSTEATVVAPQNCSWHTLFKSQSHSRFSEDPVLRKLIVPPNLDTPSPSRHLRKPHKLLAPVLLALHTLGEDMRFMTHRYEDLLRLAPIICRIALIIRPEWADYWKRLCPGVIPSWPSPTTTGLYKLLDLSKHF